MKKFIRRLQTLSDQASELRQVIESVPPKVAEIRQAVAMTGGELQQLHADVERNITDLKADGRDRLVEALHEVNGSVEVFQEAGYELGEIELELSPVARLVVHLQRMDDVHDSILRSLISANAGRAFTHALLTAVQQAEAMADKVDINGLVYHKLMFHIGPVPSIRLCWMPEPREHSGVGSAVAVSAASPAPASDRLESSYCEDSFFARTGATTSKTVGSAGEPSAIVSPAVEPSEPSSAPAVEPAGAPAPTRPVSSRRSEPRDWGASALDRFKKMPSVSKYQR